MTRYLVPRGIVRVLWPVLAAGGAFAATPAGAQPLDGAALAQLRLHFGAADADADGTVSRAEFVAYRARQWPRLDRNGDGFISRADLPRFLQSRWDGERAAEMRRNYDHDQDGRIAQQEYLAGPTPAFDRADGNHDGIVTRTEMSAAAAREGRR